MAHESFFADEAAESVFAGGDRPQAEPASATHATPEKILAALIEAAQVVIPEGEHVVHVKVTPREVVELPFGPEAHFLARLGDGNLAIKVGDVTVILEGYAAAANDPQHLPVIESSDGHPLDIATLLASTDPALDIQTAAGPGGNGGGQGADNTGAILQQFGAGNGGLGGFEGVGGQGDSTGPDGQPGVAEDGINPPNPSTPGPINSAPVAPDVFASTDEDTGIFGQFAASDPDGNTLHYSLVGPVPVGLTLTDDGKWTFVPTGHFDSLAAGDHTTVTFQYKATDGFLDSNTATVTIGIDGVNDPATFGGDIQLGIVENTVKPVSGQVVVNDLDHDQAAVATTGDFAGKYGSFHVEADGHWSYTLDNANPTIDQMHADEFTTDTLTIKSIEGTEQVLTAKIDGANDPATISGDLTGTVTEDGVATVTGKVQVSDPDHDESGVGAAGYVSAYGTLDLKEDGTWEYKLDNSKPATNALKGTDTVTDDFFFSSLDGTATQKIEITIHGHNDAPTAQNGTFVAANLNPLTADFVGVTFITPFVSDPDTPVNQLTFSVVGALPAGISLAADGTLTAHLAGNYDNLAEGQQTSVSFDYRVFDGEAYSNTATVTIPIAGVNDAPVSADDIVLTNAGVAPFDLPIPALLANDHDPEGGAIRLVYWNADTSANGDLADISRISDHFVVTDNAKLGATITYAVADPLSAEGNHASVAIHNQDGGDITGTAAHEIIIGSAAAAKIDGGGGNDLIFGGSGSETFIYHNGDVVQGGGDASLPLTLDVRGDILAIDHDVDLTKVDLSGFSGIETLSTMEAGAGNGTAQSLTLNALDVMSLTNHELKYLEGAPALRVDLEGADHLYLADNKSGDGWNQVGFGLTLAIYGHEKTLGDSTTYDAYVEVVTPNPTAGSPPNVHVNQDAPTP